MIDDYQHTYGCDPLGNVVHQRNNLHRRECGSVSPNIKELQAFEDCFGVGTIERGGPLSVKQASHGRAGCAHDVRIHILTDQHEKW